ncbi:MAG: acyl-CoA dehydrogenase [Acetobacteraceae bacterium]
MSNTACCWRNWPAARCCWARSCRRAPSTISGTAEQKARWLPGLFSGDLVATAAITEPQTGSDLRNLRCTATPVDGGYRVTGAKKWIKLGGVADLMTLLVRTGDDADGKPLTSRLVVERSASPWRATELDSVGIERISYAELGFDEVFVPAENLPGLGWTRRRAVQTAGSRRPARSFGIQAAGLAALALRIAVAYVKERTAFGRPLARFQAVQTGLADAAAKLEAARQLCPACAGPARQRRARATGRGPWRNCSATETSVEICHLAMDSMGAYGLSPPSQAWSAAGATAACRR